MGTAGTGRRCAAAGEMPAGSGAGPRAAAAANAAGRRKPRGPPGKASVLLVDEVKALWKEPGPARGTAGGAGEPSTYWRQRQRAAVGWCDGWW